jgi:hypothetical protein
MIGGDLMRPKEAIIPYFPVAGMYGTMVKDNRPFTQSNQVSAP